jgi:predicted amino acid dehydrogenase
VKRFLFLVHPLSHTHRNIMALRCRLWKGLRSGIYGHDQIATLCRFRLADRIEGIVMSIPLLPDEMIEDQERALSFLHQAYRIALAEYGLIDAVGLGSLCSVVASRGTELQKIIPVPVTTGNAATAWCMYEHARNKNSDAPIALLGSLSPVGQVLTELLHREGCILRVDKKRAARRHQLGYGSPEEIAQGVSLVLGCGPTGPMIKGASLEAHAEVIDVALPNSIDGTVHNMVYQGEGMTMPSSWRRGFWGPLYHLVSGYGWNTVLACLIEPLILVSAQRKTSFALGARIDPQAVLDFGREATTLGFLPKLIPHRVG